MKKTIVNTAAIITIISTTFIACFDNKPTKSTPDTVDSTQQTVTDSTTTNPVDSATSLLPTQDVVKQDTVSGENSSQKDVSTKK